MNIEIELDTKLYEDLLCLALKKNISLNLLIENYLLDIIAKSDSAKRTKDTL